MEDRTAQRVRVRGTVQGVGFRPFVYRLAHELGVSGWVQNDAAGVEIHAEATAAVLERLSEALRSEAPAAASIDGIEITPSAPAGYDSFEIRTSPTAGTPTTRISPDLVICDDCLREMRDPTDRRTGYPYINCTNCGPRYSIIESLPYDRERTTMAAWPMCEACAAEYRDPADRRYHAQPVACPSCGPTFRLVVDGQEIARGDEAIKLSASRLAGGEILAVKGIGGYHLACDASDEAAVRELRTRKFRKEKPFAIMASSLDSAAAIVSVSSEHEALLTSTARPIVLIPAQRSFPGVAPGSDELGVMLPYAPLHHLLFAYGAPDPMVLTSANRSNEPIAFDDDTAQQQLEGLADGFLIGERGIRRRIDDSVAGVRLGRPFIVRRARGFAPACVGNVATEYPVLGVGADLKNAVALTVDGEVVVSQHIGDLGQLDTDRAFRETIEDLLKMYAVDRRRLIIAHDLHPEYTSTRIALDLDGAAHIPVQHHEAHIAAVLLEHGCPNEPVIGIALDGTGFGRDGSIWGGEIFTGSVGDGFCRVLSLKPVEMPGGDAAARYPVQAAAAYLPDTDPETLESSPFGFPRRFRDSQLLVRRGVRTMTTTSAGRFFDAAAAVCGYTRENTYEGQAAAWFERLAETGRCSRCEPSESLDPSAVIEGLVRGRLAGEDPADLAASFHESLAVSLSGIALRVAAQSGCRAVALSGGVWQNRLLLESFHQHTAGRLRVIWGQQVPVNDGGVCVGQVAMASRNRPGASPTRSRDR